MDHPGPWQLFRKRSDNVNLHVLAQKEKYILEESVFERKHSEYAMYSHSGGGLAALDTPTVPQYLIPFTAEIAPEGESLSIYLYGGDDNPTAVINGTLNWGDDIIVPVEVYKNGDFYTFPHTYAGGNYSGLLTISGALPLYAFGASSESIIFS
jgi:hypothetical protein